MKTPSYQTQLEAALAERGLDIEVDMFRCGNLEMACKATLESLLAGSKPNAGFPSCVRVFSVA